MFLKKGQLYQKTRGEGVGYVSTQLGFLIWAQPCHQDAKRESGGGSWPHAKKIGAPKPPSSCRLTPRHRCIASKPVTATGGSRCLFAAVDYKCSKCDASGARLVLTCCEEYTFRVFWGISGFQQGVILCVGFIETTVPLRFRTSKYVENTRSFQMVPYDSELNRISCYSLRYSKVSNIIRTPLITVVADQL